MKKPLIGVLLDYSDKKEKDGGYSNYPWYALRVHYSKAISDNGGVPVLVPYERNSIKDYIKFFDGFIFPGGDFDVNPAFYGEEVTSKVVLSDDTRTIFEIDMMKEVIDNDKPLLGICAGQQLLNVVLGGTLYHDVSEISGAMMHKHKGDSDQDYHYIRVTKGTLLHKIINEERYKVNSHHHQAVRQLGRDLVVNAVAEDGVIEGIEHTDRRFCVGVEWHPEYQRNSQDKELINHFIKSCI